MVQDTIVKVTLYFVLILLHVITMKLVHALITVLEKIAKKTHCIVMNPLHVILEEMGTCRFPEENYNCNGSWIGDYCPPNTELACNPGAKETCWYPGQKDDRSAAYDSRVDCDGNPKYCTDPEACNYDGENGECVYAVQEKIVTENHYIVRIQKPVIIMKWANVLITVREKIVKETHYIVWIQSRL